MSVGAFILSDDAAEPGYARADAAAIGDAHDAADHSDDAADCARSTLAARLLQLSEAFDFLKKKAAGVASSSPRQRLADGHDVSAHSLDQVLRVQRQSRARMASPRLSLNVKRCGRCRLEHTLESDGLASCPSHM